MKLVIAAAAAATLVSTAALAQDEPRFVTIGTGGVTGVYYPAGGAICRLVNRGRSEHGLRCSAESTGGSIYNLNTLQAGELDFGVVQSDWQYHAYNGSSEFSDKPFENVRAVFSLHPEPFTVMVQADSDIQNFEDIKGKRVNVGNPGSGQRATMEVLMDALGWTMDDFALATELKPAEMAQALCDGNIDVMIYTVGHPAAAIQEAVNSCDVRLINVTGEAIEKLPRPLRLGTPSVERSAEKGRHPEGIDVLKALDSREHWPRCLAGWRVQNARVLQQVQPARGPDTGQ
jgi:TRAP transporter TAXI family solute receptor